MRFPLTIRIPNESQTSGISSPMERRIVLTLKMDSLSRYGSREALPSAPSPIRPLEPNLQGGLAAQSSQSAAVAARLHKCSVQVRLLSPPLLVFCGKRVCPLFPTSVPLVDVGSWQELVQLLFSGRIYEWHFVYLQLGKQAWSLVLFPLPLKWLWACHWPETSAVFYRTEVCIKTITENRAGRELKSPLQKVLFTNQNNSEKTIFEFNLVAQTGLQNSQWRLYKELTPVLFLPQ